MRTILDLKLAAFSDGRCFYNSSGDSGDDILYSIMERTWQAVIALEAAYRCGPSSLSEGIPKPP